MLTHDGVFLTFLYLKRGCEAKVHQADDQVSDSESLKNSEYTNTIHVGCT